MTSNPIEISSFKIKFQDFLNCVDKAIENGDSISLSKSALNLKNNNIILLKWLNKHKIIDLITIDKPILKKSNINSRTRKIEISLQLKALEINMSEISKKLKVKILTVQGYFKNKRNF